MDMEFLYERVAKAEGFSVEIVKKVIELVIFASGVKEVTSEELIAYIAGELVERGNIEHRF